MRREITDIVAFAILLAGIVLAFRTDPEDKAWEERWQSLPAADRARIAAAARSGALLADPEEIDLAAGYARRYRDRTLSGRLGVVVVPVVATVLVIAGIVADSGILLVFGGLFSLAAVMSLRSSGQLSRNLRETIDRDHQL